MAAQPRSAEDKLKVVVEAFARPEQIMAIASARDIPARDLISWFRTARGAALMALSGVDASSATSDAATLLAANLDLHRELRRCRLANGVLVAAFEARQWELPIPSPALHDEQTDAETVSHVTTHSQTIATVDEAR